MPTISKMTKPELYKLCKEQQETIKTLQFHNGCLEEEIDDLKKDSFNSMLLDDNKILREKLIEKENKIDDLKTELINYRVETIIHTDSKTYKKIYKNEKILKENSDADGVPIGF